MDCGDCYTIVNRQMMEGWQWSAHRVCCSGGALVSARAYFALNAWHSAMHYDGISYDYWRNLMVKMISPRTRANREVTETLLVVEDCLRGLGGIYMDCKELICRVNNCSADRALIFSKYDAVAVDIRELSRPDKWMLFSYVEGNRPDQDCLVWYEGDGFATYLEAEEFPKPVPGPVDRMAAAHLAALGIFNQQVIDLTQDECGDI